MEHEHKHGCGPHPHEQHGHGEHKPHCHDRNTCACDHKHHHGHNACDCGHDHEHDHDHNTCTCGHDHDYDHDHDTCTCGHEHEHEHRHDHDACCCGHEHEHDSCSCGCGCGHDHDHAADAGEIRTLVLRLIAGALLATFALCARRLPWPWAAPVLFAAAYLVIGWSILKETVEHLPRGNIFDENLLMSVASIGAFALGDHIEAIAVVALYQLGELLQGLAVSKSKRNIAKAMDIRPDHANLLDESGNVHTVAPEDVPIGSRILIRPGERVPLDGVVEDGVSALDTAALTGESLPVDVAAGSALLSGSINLQGVLTLRTTSSYADSTVQRILTLTQESAARKSTAEKFITRFARVYTPVVFALAALLALLPPLLGAGSWGDWLYRGLVFLVVSCPCALVISVPVGFLAGMGGAARHGILLKGSDVLDRLCGVGSVAFDKTGTLTQGRFTVTDVLPAAGVRTEELLTCAALCEADSTHPIARSVMEYCAGVSLALPARKDVQEFAGMGILVDADGSRYLAGNRRLLEQYGLPLPEEPAELPGTLLYLARDDRFLGLLHITDPIKPGVPAALAALRRAGVRQTVLLSGDRTPAVEQLARSLSLDDWRAELLPQDKLTAFETLCQGQTTHIYVGDGINDAPLLARADVGIAMGGLGSDAAIEAADCVLMRDDIGGVALALHCAARTRRIVRQNIAFALAAKAAVLAAAAFGYAPMWLAIFADVGVALLCVLNAVRALHLK